MNKKVIIILSIIIVLIIALGGYFLLNSKTSEKNKKVETSKQSDDEIILNIKTPILQMTSYADEEINDTYTFLKKAASDFEKEYKDANVKIKVTQFEKEDENDEIIGCFDTKEATDVLYEEYFNMSTYIHTGKVVPLDDIITDEMRNDIDDNYWEISQLNDKTYMMPFLGMQNTLCYNKDLFKQVGLEKYITDKDVIQNWSLQDFEIILSTLQKKLPKNVYPMLMYGKNEMGDTHVITLLRSRGSTFFDENGRIKLNTPEGIQAVQWLMDCDKKGYFPANAENIEIDDCYNLFMNGQLAIYINNAVLDASLRKTNINYGHVNFPSIDGKGFNTTFLNGFEVFDNGDEEKLKVAKDFVKYIYENEKWRDYSAGAIPCSNSVAIKFAEQLKDKQKYIDNLDSGWNFTGNNPNWRNVRAVFYPNIQELLYGEKSAEELAKQIEDTCNSAIEKGYENSKLHD